jgi:hypothetical protein
MQLSLPMLQSTKRNRCKLNTRSDFLVLGYYAYWSKDDDLRDGAQSTKPPRVDQEPKLTNVINGLAGESPE